MKNRLAILVLAFSLVAAVPASASEAVWEVLVPTGLQPSTLVLPDPLPAPAYVPLEILAAEPVPVQAPQIAVPPRIPRFGIARPSGRGLFDANLVIMVGLNVADYFSTKEALKYPGLEETNPLMRPFVKSPAAFAAIKAGSTVLTYLSFRAIFKRNKTMGWIMTTATNCLLSYVVANNIRLIQAARAR
jgi:Domain of unknown function (DUF5658)